MNECFRARAETTTVFPFEDQNTPPLRAGRASVVSVWNGGGGLGCRMNVFIPQLVPQATITTISQCFRVSAETTDKYSHFRIESTPPSLARGASALSVWNGGGGLGQ